MLDNLSRVPFTKMQEGEGKAAHKSDKIAHTPPRGHSTEVTPCTMANKRAQAKAKKKKGLEGYFGAGTHVPPPNLEGTPIDAVGRRRGEEGKANDRTRGEGESSLAPTAHGYKDKSNKGGEGDQRGNRKKSKSNLEGTPIDAAGRRKGGVDKANNSTRGEGERLLENTAHGCKAKSNKGGEGNQRGNREKSTKKSKKSPRKSLDDELSRRSKKTRSDDDASFPADAPGNGETANLEAI